MAIYRPLSRRDDPTYDEPVEGLPDHLIGPAIDWVAGIVFSAGEYPLTEVLRTIQLRLLRDRRPLDWTTGKLAYRSLAAAMVDDRDLALDVLDLLLHLQASDGRRGRLQTVLTHGGSVWTVEDVSRQTRLVRRAPAEVGAAVAQIESDSDRAHRHLSAAWGALMGRTPNPTDAYNEAVKAVEAAAQPVVSPTDAKATLGKMISALRDKPEKWNFALAGSTAEQVADMCGVLWKGQHRHGTSEPGAPLVQTQEEADAAFHLALTLVRLFTSGAITRS